MVRVNDRHWDDEQMTVEERMNKTLEEAWTYKMSEQEILYKNMTIDVFLGRDRKTVGMMIFILERKLKEGRKALEKELKDMMDHDGLGVIVGLIFLGVEALRMEDSHRRSREDKEDENEN